MSGPSLHRKVTTALVRSVAIAVGLSQWGEAERPFLQRLAAEGADDPVHRGILADWLEEHGRPVEAYVCRTLSRCHGRLLTPGFWSVRLRTTTRRARRWYTTDYQRVIIEVARVTACYIFTAAGVQIGRNRIDSAVLLPTTGVS